MSKIEAWHAAVALAAKARGAVEGAWNYDANGKKIEPSGDKCRFVLSVTVSDASRGYYGSSSCFSVDVPPALLVEINREVAQRTGEVLWAAVARLEHKAEAARMDARNEAHEVLREVGSGGSR